MAMGETPITIIGNFTDDPELRFTPSGAALARFTVASTPRVFDREANQWKDGTSAFFRCSAWRDLAQHIADSLGKGHRVVLSGRMRQYNWENEQGENRSMLTVEVDDIGPSLRFAVAAPRKPEQNGKSGAAGNDAWNTDSSKFSETPPF